MLLGSLSNETCRTKTFLITIDLKSLRSSGMALTDDQIKQIRIEDFKKGALQAMNWKSSAGTLKRAADVVLKQYLAARDDPKRPHLFTEGQEELYDSHIIETYFFLMGLAIENLATGIVMNIHPEYLKKDKNGIPQTLINIKSHDSYQLLHDNGIADFDEYKDLLERLSEYVLWIGRYPSPLKLEDISPKINKDGTFEWKEMPLGSLQLIPELYGKLYKRLTIESRIRHLKEKHIISESFDFKQFMKTIDEIVSFMELKKGPEQNVTQTIQKLCLKPELVEDALLVHIHYLPKDNGQRERLESKLDDYRLRREDEN